MSSYLRMSCEQCCHFGFNFKWPPAFVHDRRWSRNHWNFMRDRSTKCASVCVCVLNRGLFIHSLPRAQCSFQFTSIATLISLSHRNSKIACRNQIEKSSNSQQIELHTIKTKIFLVSWTYIGYGEAFALGGIGQANFLVLSTKFQNYDVFRLV